MRGALWSRAALCCLLVVLVACESAHGTSVEDLGCSTPVDTGPRAGAGFQPLPRALSGTIVVAVSFTDIFPIDLDQVEASQFDPAIRTEANECLLGLPIVVELLAGGVTPLFVEGVFSYATFEGDASILREISDRYQLTFAYLHDEPPGAR